MQRMLEGRSAAASGGSVSAFHMSTNPWITADSFETSSTTKQAATTTLKDQSAAARSRAPFRMPRNSQDDSVPVIEDGNDGKLAWTKLGLLTELVESVHGAQELEAPTPVQTMAIPELLKEPFQNIAFLAATGSGKTLAYALPLLQVVKAQEVFSGYERRLKKPRVLILAPTRELVVQITAEVKKLGHFVKLSSQSIVGGEDYGKQKRNLDRYIDVLVATPGRLVKHWKAGHVFLGDVSHVVLDEMDTMLEQGFQAELAGLLHPLLYKTSTPKERSQPVKGAPRVVLTSATMTKAVQRLIGNRDRDDTVTARKHYVKETEAALDTSRKIILPEMRLMKAPGLHRAVPRLRQVFVDVGNIDKLSLLSDVVHEHGGRGAGVKQEDSENQLTLVFCNTVGSCRAAQHALTEAGVESLGYHGDLNSAARAENLDRFRQAGLGAQEPRVLVATDLAARGLDVPQVDHVVMFDFPLNPLDYLHRSGRTARGVSTERAGNGRVTALVAKRDKILATAIEEAVQRGEPLDGLSSRRSDYLPGGKLNRGGQNQVHARTGKGSTRSVKSRNNKNRSRRARP